MPGWLAAGQKRSKSFKAYFPDQNENDGIQPLKQYQVKVDFFRKTGSENSP